MNMMTHEQLKIELISYEKTINQSSIQDDSELIELLKRNYNISVRAKNRILSELKNRTVDFNKNILSKRVMKEKQNEIIGKCFLAGINPLKDNKFIGTKAVKIRITASNTREQLRAKKQNSVGV
jgi:Zn-dependent peptidase ImmA (M78 family)